MQHIGVELTAENRRMLYVPEGFAHGFQTLEDDAEVTYQVSEFYTPQAERGLRYNDPWLGISWPGEPSEISQKDSSWPSFDPDFHGIELLKGLSTAHERRERG
jgi:dTDP-4-dehydrorhamnose 3,5-epimerase